MEAAMCNMNFVQYNFASITAICSVNFGHSLAMPLSHISFSLHRRHSNQKDLIERDPLNDGVQLITEPRKTNQCFTARNVFIHRKENFLHLTGNLSYKVGHDRFGSVTTCSHTRK